MNKYDAIIVGAGVAGAVSARRLSDAGMKVLLIDKREHIAGNCYDYKNSDGVLIHKYGPHIFHTNSQTVYEFLSRFTEWYQYHHEVVANVNGKYLPVPFNLNTLKVIYDSQKADSLRKKLINKYKIGTRVTILQLLNDDDQEIKELADYVYDNIFLHYTLKQWGLTPDQIDPSVTARVPVLISEDNGYFQDQYQGMPMQGYTRLFENMLNQENINILLSTDAKDVLSLRNGQVYFRDEVYSGKIIFTGAIDEFLDNKYGRLPYRTLEFKFETYHQKSYQPKAVVNYTVSEEYTRITEFTKMTGQDIDITTIVKEYPKQYRALDGEIPYYAIINQDNQYIYNKYKNEINAYKNIYLLGRLAQYQYFNIDAIALEAIKLSDKLLRN